MARWLSNAVPHIWAGAIGVILALVLGLGLYFVVDASEGGTDAPTPQQTTSTP